MAAVTLLLRVLPFGGKRKTPPFVLHLGKVLPYVWRHNTLLSILCGTVCYMLLVQLVF